MFDRTPEFYPMPADGVSHCLPRLLLTTDHNKARDTRDELVSYLTFTI